MSGVASRQLSGGGNTLPDVRIIAHGHELTPLGGARRLDGVGVMEDRRDAAAAGRGHQAAPVGVVNCIVSLRVFDPEPPDLGVLLLDLGGQLIDLLPILRSLFDAKMDRLGKR